MDRRSFFRSAIDKGGKTVVKAVDVSVKKQASHWIRPPFAINELEFLLAGTRCNDCIDACPHDVIFSLSARVGVRAAGTPALDLLNKGCHLCEDWACVAACTPNALIIPNDKTDATDKSEMAAIETEETNNPPMPKLARASIDTKACLPYSGPECGACIASCPVDGALTLDMVKPIIDELLCSGCGMCREACITEPKAINIASL
jgi:ferredoxin-type protein NapG